MAGFTPESFDEDAQRSTQAALASQIGVHVDNIYIIDVVETPASRRRRLLEGAVAAITVQFEVLIPRKSSISLGVVQKSVNEICTSPEAEAMLTIDLRNNMMSTPTPPLFTRLGVVVGRRPIK